MKQLWVHRTIDAPSGVVWMLLTDPTKWPTWGPTVREAAIDDGRMEHGSTGSVTTVGGVTLPFEITDYEDGKRWAWRVAGVAATDHAVEELGPDRCRVGIGVPWAFTLYLVVCRAALSRLDTASKLAATNANR